MISALDIEDWHRLQDFPILDVRSPKEYEQGHMPPSHSVPLFTDEERAVVGTLYKQIGREQAMDKALELVGPKMSWIVHQSKSIAPDKKIRVHCWRGGMRSGSVAWLLNTMGFHRVCTLNGGYKTYRAWIRSFFERPYPFLVVGGRTGSAKTEVLKILSQSDESVIDLENCAHHKGSAFGWIGEPDQPNQEQFENLLGESLCPFVQSNRIWIEDESEHIGKLRIPLNLFYQIRSSKVFFLDIEASVRIPHLVKTYSTYGNEKLEQSILKIQKRLGGLNTKNALKALASNDYHQVAKLALNYYDKSYEAGLQRREPGSIVLIKSDTVDAAINAELILKSIHQL